jgi:tRNA dimethylallyltransferase
VHEDYSAGRYAREAGEMLEVLFQKYDTVVCCGGSMLYIDAVINGFDDLPSDKNVRDHWNQRLSNEGLEVLQHALKARDPEYYTQVDLQNPHRLIRALEVCDIAGKPFSELRLDRRKDRAFEVEKVGLDMPREKLYGRIDARVLKMMEEGLLEEVKGLHAHRHLQALNTVGYKELFDYLDGVCTFEFAVQKIQQHTRNFAKRQLTWWRRDESIVWRKPIF